MHIFTVIFVGLLTGFIVAIKFKRKALSNKAHLIIGLIGSIVGSWFGALFFFSTDYPHLRTIIFGILGAVIALIILNKHKLPGNPTKS